MCRYLKVLLLIISAFAGNMAYCADVETIISSLKQKYAPDSRTSVWTISGKLSSENDSVYVVTGETDKAEAVAELIDELNKSGIAYLDSVKLLPGADVDNPWALVSISVASIRSAARSGAELASQAIMGTPVKVLEHCGNGMSRIQTPDNYIGYVTDSSLSFLTDSEFNSWRTASRYVVTSYQATLFEKPNGDESAVVSDLVLGTILQSSGKKGKYVRLVLPDGRIGYAKKSDVAEFDKWSKKNFDMPLIEKNARRMMGSPYLWGGMSTKMADCSGFVKTVYFANGIILQRDASQQALTGKPVDWVNWQNEAEPGDLIFVGTKNGRVTHVMMYLGNGKYIHSSGRVKINSLNSRDDDYLDYNVLSMTRIKGQVGTKGIVAVESHPWYFMKK